MRRKSRGAKQRRADRTPAEASPQGGFLDAPETPATVPKRWLWLAAAVIVLAAVSAFFPVLQAGFTNWDDDVNVTGNPYLNPPSWKNLAYLWTHSYRRLYVPLVYTSYLFDAWLGGGKAWAYHLTNLALHVLAALLALSTLSVLVPLQRPAGRGSRSAVPLAAGALMFAVHPIQTEAVAWVTGRKDLLCGLLGLLAVWQYASWRVWGGRWRYGVALAAFALSLLAKPLVSLPLALLALDFFLLKRSWRMAFGALWPWFVLGAAWTVVTMESQTVPAELAGAVAVWQRPLVSADSLVFYMRKLAAPVGLSPVYGRFAWDVVRSGWSYAALAGVCAALFLLFRRRDRWSAATGVFLACVLPVLGFVPFLFQIYSTVADRYVYSAMLAVALAVAWGLENVALWPAWPRRLAYAGLVVVLAFLGAQSNAQARRWHDSLSLWAHALAAAPNSAEGHNNFGMAYVDANRPQDAVREFRAALALKPDYADANNNLGNQLMDTGQLDEAIACFRRSLERKPNNAAAYNNLGNALSQKGNLPAALNEYISAARLEPWNADIQGNLALAYGKSGLLREGIESLRAYLQDRPNHPKLRVILGNLLQRLGMRSEAIAEYREALRLDPSNSQARAGLQQLGG